MIETTHLSCNHVLILSIFRSNLINRAMASYSRSRWDQFSEDSGKESLLHSDSDLDMNPEEAGPSKTDRKALFFCDICEVECSSIDALQKHFAGIKHQKKLGLNGLSSNLKAKYEMRESDELSGKIVACTLCKVVFHGLERAIHFKSEKHRALSNFANESVKIEHSQFLEIIADAPADCMEGEIDIDAPEKVKDGYRCMLCDATLTTPTLFQAHIEGKKHQKKARWHYLCKEGESLEVNQYWCRLCNTFCTDRDALTAHYRGKNHIKILQKNGWIKGDEDVDSKPTDSRGKIRIKEELMSDSDESEYKVDLAKVKMEPGLKFHSSERSKKRSYHNSRSETPSSEYSRSPSPPPVRKKKNRSRSPSARKRRNSSRSPPHKRKSRSPSLPPAHKRKDRRLSLPSAYKRKDRSPSPLPARKRKGRSPSPPPKRKVSPPSAYKIKDHSRSPSSSPIRRRKSSSGRKRSPSHSPVHKKKNRSPSPVYSSSPSPSPIRRRKSSSGRKKSPSYSSVRKKKDRSSSPSPILRRKSSSGHKQNPSYSPIHKKKNRSPSPVRRRKSHKEVSRSPSESSSRSRSDSRTRISKQIQQSNRDDKKRKRSYSREREQSRTSPPRKRARTNSNRSRSRERWRSKSPPARRNSANSKRGRSARGSSSSQSRSRWRSTDEHSDTTQDSQTTISSRGRGRFRRRSFFTEHDDRNVRQYSSGSRSPSPPMEKQHRRSSSSGMWKRGGWRQERSRFFRDRRDSRHFEKIEREPEPVSSGEDHNIDELHFEGFSQDLSSDDSSAPPISSLSVSYILHALLKSCKKN